MLQDRKSTLTDIEPLMWTEHPSATEPALGAARVGAELRMARLRLGATVPQVAARLRIRGAYLEAIEAGRIEALPGNVYALAFVRTYAAALGLQPDEVARRFRAEVQGVDRPAKLQFPSPAPDRRVPVGAVVLLGAILALAGYANWYQRSANDPVMAEAVPLLPERLALLVDPPSGPVLTAQVAPPLVDEAPEAAGPSVDVALPPQIAANSASASPIPMPMMPAPVLPPSLMPTPVMATIREAVPDRRMVLRVTADAWVQVRERGGQVLLSRVLRAGESWPVPPGPALLLTTGNAGGTELVFDGVAAPRLGAAGAVRRDVPLEMPAPKPGTASTARPQPQ